MAVWLYTIKLGDVFHNESMTFEQRRDAIVARLRRSKWLAGLDSDDERIMILDDLAEAPTSKIFDELWGELYYWADDDRAWIETIL